MLQFKKGDNILDNLQTVAMMYDFDETLSKGYMQDYSLIPLLGEDKNTFWNNVNKVGSQENMDGVLAYMFVIMQKARKNNMKIDVETLKEYGKEIEYFNGVLSWFDRINEYGKQIGLNIEHYKYQVV